jgi:acetoin utilization deacetylase AcuC-like enzyme
LGWQRILIVDWDYHHGDGTESFFYEEPSVLYFSTHDWDAYPGTGDPARRGANAGLGYNVNVSLPCGATDADIVAAFTTQLVPAADAFMPDLVLISAGFDSRIDDRLGCFDVTDAGFAQLTRIVMAIAARHCQGRLVSLLEGGYNVRGLASAVETHVRTLLTDSATRP